MKKRFLSILVTAAMLLSLLPMAAFAEGDVETLQSKIDAAESGATIALTENTTESITIPAGKTITLDLAGHKLTNNATEQGTDVADSARKHTITNNGTLTIIDSASGGVVDNVSHAKAAVYNAPGATATLDGGTYDRSYEKGKSTSDNGGNSFYTLKNFGAMTINEGVTVKQDGTGHSGTNGKYSSLVANGWQSGATAGNDGKEPAVQNGGATLTINGGTFDGGLNTIKNDDYGTLTIEDGTFENYVQHAFFNANVATVNGGTFTSQGRGAIYTFVKWDDTFGKGQLTITGGEFKSTGTNVPVIEINGSGKADITITGGTFSSDVSAYLEDGYFQSGEGVVFNAADAAAKIGETLYRTVKDAVAAAPTTAFSTKAAPSEATKITLLKDTNDGLDIGASGKTLQNIEIDLNGHTLTLGPAVGSSGTETNGLRVLSYSKVKI